MKWNLTKGIIVIAVLTIPAQLRLVAQDELQQEQVSAANPEATGDDNFLIASGFLCDSNYSAPCPAVARASDGETVEITGAGSLSGKSVIAVGSFTAKTSNGYIVTSGVWAATGLMSFESYGIDPGALLRDHPQFRRLAPFPMGRMMPGPMSRLMAGPIAAGGVAVIRIRLLPDAGSPTDALLQVNCAKGKVPEDEQGDGVRLTIEGGGPVFDEQVSGHTVFLLRRPAPNFAWKQAAGQTQ